MTIPARFQGLGDAIESVPSARLHPAGLYADWLKRPFDVVFVLAIMPVLVPLVALLALLVALRGGQPFYSQERVGRDGRIFRMWKLRSMVPDAEAVLARLLAEDPDLNREWALKQKLADDPRITPLGRFLRRASLDELPQFFNVLRGDMSLIGPRPMMPDQRALYPGTAYYRLRPGISGAWQVAGRNCTCFAERARFDSDYLDRVSFATDVGLLAATLRVVLRGTGC